MRVLVTGASGFAGSWLVKELRAAGHVAIPAPPARELDLSRDEIEPLVRETRPDAVAHLAAVSSRAAAAADPERAHRVNVIGTERLFASLDAAGSPASVLLTSSAVVYGTPPIDVMPIPESHPVDPRDDYARTKALQEEVAHGAQDRRRVIVVRPFNHTGPGHRATVVPVLARQVRELLEGTIQSIGVGDLGVRRDFLDVRDVVRAYRLLLERSAGGGATYEVLNVASGEAISVGEVLAALAALAGARVRTHFDPGLLRPDEPQVLSGDAAKLRDITGWKPTIPWGRTLGDVLGI